MNLKEYHEKTPETAIYNNKAYPMLGLIGEVGEFERNYKDIKEAGDVIWYISQLCHILDIDFTDFIVIPNGLLDFECFNFYLILSELSEMYKKYIRDGNINRDVFKKKLYIIFLYVSYTSPYKLGVILKTNIEKLIDRKKRNVLHGSGNNR